MSDLPVVCKNDVSAAEAALDELWDFDDDLDARVNEVIQVCELTNLDLVLLPALVELLKRHRIHHCNQPHNHLLILEYTKKQEDTPTNSTYGSTL